MRVIDAAAFAAKNGPALPGEMPVPETSNPLLELHRQAAAETQNYGEFEIVTTFGRPQLEYAAIHKGCGLLDQPQRGFIELTGRDRLMFLNNILTNQTFDKSAKRLMDTGKGDYAFLLQAKSGRIVADMNVLELGERTLLAVEKRLAAATMAALGRYVFSEDVRLRDAGGDLHEIALHGPGTMALLAEIAGVAVEKLPSAALASAVVRLRERDVIVYRDDVCGVPGLHLIVPADAVAGVWGDLFALAPAAGSDAPAEIPPKRARLRPIGWAAFNTARIEAGRGLFGIDFDENFLPGETGQLDRAVSFTKGCYPGQEIVARMHSRKQLARQVVGFRMDADALPIAGAPIQDGAGEQIGAVTSSTPSPILGNANIGLAVLKRPHFEVGAKVMIAAEGAMQLAMVVKTPFVGGAES